ncbi:terminase large subunit [Petrachloros mirabilis]
MSTAINFELEKAIRCLPGYDPFAQAGDCVFDPDRAEYVIEFVEKCCTHVRGALKGKPLLLESWEKGIFGNLYGWYQPDGRRRYREALIFIPRGNAKTTLAAAITNVHLFLEAEGSPLGNTGGAELYSSAAERDQARLCFEIVAGMIRQEPLMAERAQIYKYSVVVGDKSYKALSAMAGSKHGFSPQLVVNDELHAHKTAELTEVLMTGQGKREEPLCVHLTTSDYEREGSICNQKHDYACKVRDGVINDPAFLPVIYEASKDDDWTDVKIWKKANPNFGVSVPEDYLRRECERAKEDPSYENTFKRLHLNIRTEAFNRWISSEKWDACRGEVFLEGFAGQPCWAGLDLASTQDFNAFVLVFKRDGKFYAIPKFWVPEETAEKRERERRIPYSVWARDGWLKLTEGDVSDPDTIHADIIALIEKYKLNVREIAVDRMFQGMDLIRRLAADGFEAFAHGQGSMGMIPPTKTTKDAILGSELVHDGNPVLRWMMSNVVVHPGEAKEYPMRDKSADKIDGVVAMIMAVGRADFAPVQKKSYYADNDFEF